MNKDSILNTYDQINNIIIKKYLYIEHKNNLIVNDVNDENDILLRIIYAKVNLSIYSKINNYSDINTLLYMFNHISAGIFVKIYNNKLEAFIPFQNKYFKNNWSNNIKLDSVDGINFISIIEFQKKKK